MSTDTAPSSVFDEALSRSRQSGAGSLASIWAPQPQPLDTTWPKALDSFSRAAESETQLATRPELQNHSGPMITREDVFGPSPPKDMPSVGAIGDGRKKVTPDFEPHTHVEQLLRTLDLNSPDPYHLNQKPPLNLSFETSPGTPDFSPVSISSALLTPTDLSPTRPCSDINLKQQLQMPYEMMAAGTRGPAFFTHPALLFEPGSPTRLSNSPPYLSSQASISTANSGGNNYPIISNASSSPIFRTYNHEQSSPTSPSLASYPSYPSAPQGNFTSNHQLYAALSAPNLSQTNVTHRADVNAATGALRSSIHGTIGSSLSSGDWHIPQQPINFLSLLHPSSSPPYHSFVSRIIKSSDQQASIFLQQKLKVADIAERSKIVDAICARGFEMMAHRFGNWAVQRCLEAAFTPEERKKIASCMRGRIVELATNCYGCHVLQKALDCEEDIRLLIVSELLLGDPAQTLVNKHASHVWSKIMELTWTPPAPPIFTYVNKSLKGKWAALACHETGSLVVQHAFENLEDSAKDGIIDELLNQGLSVFSEVAKNQWGSYCVQHILEHGSDMHRQLTLDHLIAGLLEYSTNEQGYKSITKALKEGGKETLDRVVKRMCEPAKSSSRRAMVVDLALSVTGSQLIASVLPSADREQRALLYDCIRGHIVTLRGCKTGSKVIWLL
ncbi:armadillo-type protein [Lentinula novae-zelandiae]|nr:armadillo-type protein [Lentinula novae-zelandiae]